MTSKSKNTSNAPNTRQGVIKFEKAAKAYGVKSTKSKATANSALVDIGTHTPKGNLRKAYK